MGKGYLMDTYMIIYSLESKMQSTVKYLCQATDGTFRYNQI